MTEMTNARNQESLRTQIATALAEKFTSAYGSRNPHWDIDGPDDDTNPYCLAVPMETRIRRDLMVTFTGADGHPSLRPATIPEVTDAILAVVQPGLEATGRD